MRSGVLDRRITILAPTMVEVEGYGKQPGPYVPIVKGERVPAQRQDMLPSNSESISNGLRIAYNESRLRIRYRKDIKSDMRIVMHDEDDRIYEISGGPSEIGRREWIELTIKEYSTNGIE